MVQDAADFFSGAKAFWLSALGSGVLTWLLAYPADCTYRTAFGRVRCEMGSTCPATAGATTCSNVLGLNAFADYAATATIGAIGLGLLCGALAAAFSSAATRRRPDWQQ